MAIEECKPKPSVKQTQNIHEGKEEENRPPVRPNPRRPTDDIRRTAPPYGGIERARHRSPALGHRHAIHRCRDGGKPRCKRLSLYRIESTTTWLFWGLCAAASTGFSVQVAHRIGAGDWDCARSILRRSVPSTFAFSALLAAIGVSVSGALPQWLGGDSAIRSDASLYFLIFSLFLPILQMNFLAAGMLRCSGNMRIPSIAGVLMCILDVVFNFFLIFPSRYP